MIAEAQRVLSEFKVADSADVTYFGTGGKTMIQWLTRLSKDFNDRLVVVTVEAEFKDLEYHDKAIKVVTNICRGVRQHSLESQELNEIVMQQKHWMSLDPVVQNVIPSFLLEGQYKFAAMAAKPCQEFWLALFGDKLVSLTIMTELAADKLVEVQDSEDTFKQSMEDLFSEACLTCIQEQRPDLKKEVWSVRLIVLLNCGTVSSLASAHPDSEYEAALADESPVAKALTLRRAGRNFKATAKTKLAMLHASTAKIDKINKTADAVGSLVQHGVSITMQTDDVIVGILAALQDVQEAALGLNMVDAERKDESSLKAFRNLALDFENLVDFTMYQMYLLLDSHAVADEWPERKAESLVSCLKIVKGMSVQSSLRAATRGGLDEVLTILDGMAKQAIVLTENIPLLHRVHSNLAAALSEDVVSMMSIFTNFSMDPNWGNLCGRSCIANLFIFDVTLGLVRWRWHGDHNMI